MALRNSVPIQVDAAAGIEPNALGLEERALETLDGPVSRPCADLTPRVDHAMPRDVGVIVERGKGVPDLSRVPRQARGSRHTTVRTHAPPRNPADGGVDAVAAGHDSRTVG